MIKISSAQFFSDSESCKLDKALALADQVLIDPRFQAEIEAIPSFPDPDKTPTGKEVMAALSRGDIMLALTIMSYSWWNIGKRGEVAHEDDSGVTFNRRFFSTQDLPSLTATIVHEGLHQQGFSHDYARTARREQQSPYRVGDIAEKWAAVLLKSPKAS